MEIDLWQDRGVPINKTALEPAQPHSCRHLRQPKSPTRGTTPRPGARPNQENEVCNAFDNLIWPHFDTYNWPHLINKDAGPVRQKSYGPSRDGVQRKGWRL